jgi:AcrR family transcriptional regulator
MLLYHFGSKEGLFVEVVRHTEHRQQDLLADLTRRGGGTLEDSARAMWQRLRAPELAPLERLFFEIYGQALQGRPYADTFLAEVVEAWIEPVLPALETEGLSSAQARVAARLGLAVVRGLLLDVLATGDGAGVDEAFELFLAATSAHRGG